MFAGDIENDVSLSYFLNATDGFNTTSETIEILVKSNQAPAFADSSSNMIRFSWSIS